jgi:hypothetical protein
MDSKKHFVTWSINWRYTMANSTITREVVTIRIDPRDKRKSPACYDLNTPILLGRFLQDNRYDADTGSVVHGTLSFIRGTEYAWVQQVLAQVEAGYDFWERV